MTAQQVIRFVGVLFAFFLGVGATVDSTVISWLYFGFLAIYTAYIVATAEVRK